MKYDFTSIIDRRGEGFSFIPMWAADMNFAACPAVTREIKKRAEHPLFVYYNYSDEYCQAVAQA